MAASATVGILRVLLTANTTEYTTAMQGIGQSMKTLQKGFTTIGTQATAAGKILSTAFTLPLVAIGVGAAKSAIDFETAFANVAKTVDGVADSTGKLTPQGEALAQTFRNLAKEIPATTTELSEIAALGGQLGVPIEQLDFFTKNVAALGIAVDGISTEEATTGIAQIGNASGEGTAKVAEIASALVHLGNNSAATEGQILEFTKRLVGAGTSAGLSVPDVMALGTAMANVGVNAEAGGTAMSVVIQKIGVAVSEGGAKLTEFARVAGVSAEDFAAIWRRSPIEAIQLFVGGLSSMKDRGVDLNLTMGELGTEGIRVSDTLKRLSGDSEGLGRALVIANEGFASGNAHLTEAEKKYATTANELAVLWNRIKDIGITLGQAFLPLMKDAIGVVERLLPFVESAVKGFSSLPEPVRLVGVALAGILAAAGPVLLAFGGFMTAIVPLLPVVSGFGTALLALIAPAAGPLVLIGAALVGLVAIWVKWGDDITRIVSETYTAVKTWLIDKWDGSIFQSFARMIQAMAELFAALAVKLGEKAAEAYTAVKGWLLDKLQPVFAAVKALVDPIVAAWTTAKDKVIGLVTALYTGVKTWLVDKFVAIVDAVKQKIDAVTQFFKDMKDKVVGHSFVPEMVDAIGVHMARLQTVMVQPAQQATADVLAMFEEMRNSVNQRVDRLVSDTGAQFEHMRVQTGITLQGLGQSFSQMFGKGIPGIFQTFTQGPLSDLIGQVAGALGGKAQRIVSGFQGIMQQGFTIVSGIARAFAGDFSGIVGSIIGMLDLVRRHPIFGGLAGLLVNHFRGGEEGTQVNPARDEFLSQFGGAGTGPGSGFWELGAQLEAAVGSAMAEQLHAALRAADTMAEFNAAVGNIQGALGGGGFTPSGGSGFDSDTVAPGAIAPELQSLLPAGYNPADWGGRFATGVELMAEGGMGRVTRPTLFLAGEAGPEDYAFSGANKSLAGAGGVTIENHNHFHGPVFAEDDYIETKVAQGVMNAIRTNRGSALTGFHAALGLTR